MALAYAGHKRRGGWVPSHPNILLRKNITPDDPRKFDFEFEEFELLESKQLIQVVVDSPTNACRTAMIPMRCIRITDKDIILSSENIRPTRMTKVEPKKFLALSFAKLNFRDYKNNHKLKSAYIRRVLMSGIRLNGIKYEFCGHSNSQLQSRCCYLRISYTTPISNLCHVFCRQPEQKMQKLINKSGNFEKIKDVSKFSKRIALLFTSSISNFELDPNETHTIEDVVEKEKNFTDGCGFIDSVYAEEILNEMNLIPKQKKNFNTSVFQIRYRGFKGILTSVPTSEIQRLEDEDKTWFNKVFLRLKSRICKSDTEQKLYHKVLFRKSMKKFETNGFFQNFCRSTSETLCIVEQSKSFSYGYLNEELITLLATLGISDSVLQRKLNWYLNLVKTSLEDINSAIEFSILKNRIHLTKQLKRVRQSKSNSVPADLIAQLGKLEKDEKDNFYKESKVRIRILVPQSRLLFGVSDPTGKLKSGECFVRYTDTLIRETDFNHHQVQVMTGKIVVGRNPCLHPGDIQHFIAVDIPELNYLVDCIVFSVNGDTPPASKMSGGDLDGDKFFVCWDPELIPFKTYIPEDYSKLTVESKVTNQKITEEDRINYFANYDTALQLGYIKNLYLNWVKATPLRAESLECIQLNRLHSKCVDGGRVEIPLELRNYPHPTNQEFILSILERQIMKIFPCPTPIAPEEVFDPNDWHDAVPEEEKSSGRLTSVFHMLRRLLFGIFGIIILYIVYVWLFN